MLKKEMIFKLSPFCYLIQDLFNTFTNLKKLIMKKVLLLNVMMLFSITLFAQTNKNWKEVSKKECYYLVLDKIEYEVPTDTQV